jgi:hypothetical protein
MERSVKKSVMNAWGVAVVGLAVAVMATGPGCSSEPPGTPVFGVWRVSGVVGADADEIQHFDTVMRDQDMAMFFEFAETSATAYIIVGDQAKSDTKTIKWESKGGKLFCKNPTGHGEATVIFVDGNTIHWERDSKEKGMILTRSSPEELAAVMKNSDKRQATSD